MMNKKLLPLAVLTAVATGGLSTAQAVHVNNNGTGQVLIYPYYSVEGGQDTYVNIVNTTDQVKAVKVRFLEGMNSQEVLDFNLYLSPKDHWSGMVTRQGESGARLTTVDESCTVPSIVGRPGGQVDFRALQFAEDSVNGTERTREGYVEIIEMGVVSDVDDNFEPATWATHDSSGVPDDCAALSSAWSTGGTWSNSPAGSPGTGAATGGLYGYGMLINPADGVSAAYDATAFDNFWGDGGFNHSEPGDLSPSLQSGVSFAQVIDGNQLFDLDFASPVDALSATIMQASIMNDYVLAPEINAATDWVVNFPTKRFYTNISFNEDGTPADPADAPFTSHWDRTTSRACEPFAIDFWDREEQSEQVDDVDFSPRPSTDPIALCKEVNVVSFNDESPLYASDRIGANIDVVFDNGWMSMDFTGDSRVIQGTTIDGQTTYDFNGLPVIGFAVQRYTNGDLDGLLSNYMGLVNHKGERQITSAD